MRRLPAVTAPGGGPTAPPFANALTAMSVEISRNEAAWTRYRASITGMFDAQAPRQPTELSAQDAALVEDALARGGPVPSGTALDVGAGAAAHTVLLRDTFEAAVALDLSLPMLRRATGGVPRVQADAAHLPFRSSSVTLVVLANMFLFPAEVARVLQPDGVVVWISSHGARTSIYLPPEAVETALPGRWDGCTSGVGTGTWTTLRRTDPT